MLFTWGLDQHLKLKLFPPHQCSHSFHQLGFEIIFCILQCNENSCERIVNPQPLTDAEFEKLADVLKRFGDKRAVNCWG